jgi:hypothetical protein
LALSIKHNGFLKTQLVMSAPWHKVVQECHYAQLDRLASQSLIPGGYLFEKMNELLPSYFSRSQQKIEHIISLREGPQSIDEEGIWHDDGSRLLAFSLSLNKHYENIKGGQLSLRQKDQREEVMVIGPRPFGTLHLFCTGQDDWEHKTSRVHTGSRLVLAGWLT